MSQQARQPVVGGDRGATAREIITAVEVEAARKRAIRARCLALHPAKMGERDIRYVRANFLPLSELTRHAGRDLARVERLIDDGLLPRPSYVLPDGTGMFPPDLLAMWDAVGDIADLPQQFHVRYQAAAAARRVTLADDEVEQAWIDYLTGMYGVCLKKAKPETILDKGVQTAAIETLLSTPRPDDLTWLNALRAAVDRLDALERPFTGFDRRRFGRPTSRDRLIAGVRRSYPDIAGAPASSLPAAKPSKRSTPQ